jgi:hypothetical protein
MQAQQVIGSPVFGIKTLPTKISYRFGKLAKKIQAELKELDEARQKLIEDCHGVLSEDKAQFAFSPEDAPAFAKGMADLFAEAFDLDPVWPMAIDELGNVELSPADLLILEPLISE